MSIGEQAEGEIIAETRRDWITDFSSLNANTKKLLNVAVSSLASIEIALNDVSGYIDSAEQERILDINYDKYQRAVRILSKLDHNDIRGVDT